MVLCGTVSSFLTSKMVELVGVEPMTYTMRTYRSSQLSYSPILASSPGSPELTVYNIVISSNIATWCIYWLPISIFMLYCFVRPAQSLSDVDSTEDGG